VKPVQAVVERFDVDTYVSGSDVADEIDEIDDALLDLAHWRSERAGQ
jgi:hypothetical protein